MFQAIAVFWLLLDFVTKQYVLDTMQLRESIPVWEGVFHLTYVENSGAAFSMMQGQFWLFYTALILMLIMVIWFWWKEKPHHWMPVVGTALVIAGAVGNTVDRIVQGAVVDMFDFRLINFPIFNIADIGITVGTTIFLIWLLFLSDHAVVRDIFAKRKVDDTKVASVGDEKTSAESTEDSSAADEDSDDVVADDDDDATEDSDDDDEPSDEPAEELAEEAAEEAAEEPAAEPAKPKQRIGIRQRFENVLNRWETSIEEDVTTDTAADTDITDEPSNTDSEDDTER